MGEEEMLVHSALCVRFAEAVVRRSGGDGVPVGTAVLRLHALLQVQEQSCLQLLLLVWRKQASGMQRQTELGHHLASACQRHSDLLELFWAMRAWVDVVRMQADQTVSPCNHPPVTVARGSPHRRLLFTLVSAQDSVYFRACVAGWREFVDNQRRLEFQDARLEESRRMSNLVDAACTRWHKWEQALLVCALLHHWSSYCAGSKASVVPEPPPRSALHLRNIRSSTLQRVLMTPHSKRITPSRTPNEQHEGGAGLATFV